MTDIRYLPALRREHGGRIVLDGSLAARRWVDLLADLYRHDPAGVGALLVEIADVKDQADRERELGPRGIAAVVRDELVGELLDDLGGAEVHLDPRGNHRALMQARALAEEAGRILEMAAQRVVDLQEAAGVREARTEQQACPACALWVLLSNLK